MREITPPFYKEKECPACDEISGADLKPEENFVPGIRSRFRFTGPTANLSQPEFVERKIEHGLGFYPDTDVSYTLARSSLTESSMVCNVLWSYAVSKYRSDLE